MRVVHAAVQMNQVVVRLELVYGTLGELIHVCIVPSSNWAVLSSFQYDVPTELFNATIIHMYSNMQASEAVCCLTKF